MDGHFVPNLTFGAPVVNAFRVGIERPLDIHLMVEDPESIGSAFRVEQGDAFIVHLEAADDLSTLIERMRASGADVGISIRPGTPIERLFPMLSSIDRVLVMSVEPGFGGQRFLPDSVPRIRALRREIGERPVSIAVDGGINRETAPEVVAAGAEILVVGSALFGAPDPVAAAHALLAAVC
jgi:ribulose-phosphate 3-epimerase